MLFLPLVNARTCMKTAKCVYHVHVLNRILCVAAINISFSQSHFLEYDLSISEKSGKRCMNINLIKIGSEINFVGALLLQAHKNEMEKFKYKYKSFFYVSCVFSIFQFDCVLFSHFYFIFVQK